MYYNYFLNAYLVNSYAFTGVLTVALTSNFHADIVKLINNGLPVRLAAINDRIEYQPDNLKEFLKKYKINSFNYEPLYRPDNFDKIYNPNYTKY